jgi:hypothetical protein
MMRTPRYLKKYLPHNIKQRKKTKKTKRGQYPLIEKLSTTNMPRKARFFISTIPVDMVIRGNSRKTIFAEE